MTYEEREAIFSKEALSVADVQALFGVCKSEATNIMNTIRRQTGDRLKVQGKIHIEDYLKHFGIEANRYTKRNRREIKIVSSDIVDELKKEAGEGAFDDAPLIRSSSLLDRRGGLR